MANRLVKCRDCKHDRGYYSDSWCEKGNKQHSVELFVECNDFIGYDEKEYNNKKQYGLNRDSDFIGITDDGIPINQLRVCDLLNKQKEENIKLKEEIEALKLQLHINERVCYMLDQEVVRAMEDGFEISDWYKEYLMKCE